MRINGDDILMTETAANPAENAPPLSAYDEARAIWRRLFRKWLAGAPFMPTPVLEIHDEVQRRRRLEKLRQGQTS